MIVRIIAGTVAALALTGGAFAQTVCPPTPEFTPCDLVFDIPSAKTDQPLDLQAEFRSPHQSTGLVRAFWDGGTRWIIRYTPAESGTYEWRLTGAGFAGKEGRLPMSTKPPPAPERRLPHRESPKPVLRG